MEKNDTRKQLTLRIPENLHREFKVNAAKKGQSMGEVAVELIKRYLERESDPM
jgi:predicted HicB family RNase H-like nuclease